METELKTKKKWPYLWYDPQTGLPFDFKPDNQPPKTPTATRTTKLREELLKKPPEDQSEPFPRHILTTPKSVFAGTTKSQRLRQMAASKLLQEQRRRESLSKAMFKARTPPASIREDIQLRPQKTTNSQRLREEFARKAIEKRTEDTIAAFLESHRRVLSSTMDTSPPRFQRRRSDVDTGFGDSKKNPVAPVNEKKTNNPRPIQGKGKRSATALSTQNSQTSLLNKKPNQTNLARARYSSEPKLHKKGKHSMINPRALAKKQESVSTAGKKPQVQAVVSVDKVNKAISKNRVNFLKEKMKRISVNEGRNVKQSSYTEECLKMLNKSKGDLEEPEKMSPTKDKNFKVIMPPAIQRGQQKPYSPSNRIRDMVRNSLSTTSDDDSSSGSEI